MSFLTYKGIYKIISKRVRLVASGRKKTKAIPYSLYFKIISKFFEILARDLVTRGQRIYLPLGMGFLEVRKKEQRHAFHIRKDNTESKAQGVPVRYKVPILEDYYHKVIWSKQRGDMMGSKIMMAKNIKELIKDKNNASKY
tara:strand:- start:2064 stop:2486 length:423 start_codon:yes stop_codon:yes gene_type:complete